jgi:predicted AAA+ superfamily ATPase
MADERLFEALSHWNRWEGSQLDAGVERTIRASLTPWLHRPQVLAICGMRRSGKSTLMRQLARSLIDEGVAAKEILFVNFEEPIFLERALDPAALDRVFDTFHELLRPGPRPHLFLDEVQNVDGWARWVRARTETGRARVVVSGSSSRLLEPEIASVLTGRSVTRTLWPLSFREQLRFRGIDVGRSRASLLAQGAQIRQQLGEYLRWGGMPEVVLTDDVSVKETLLKNYFRDILYRDVVARHQVRDVHALEQVAHHYLVNTASLSTFNRVKNAYGLAMDQVRAYTSHLEESYLISAVPAYSPKVSQQARAPRKVYAIDTGLRNAVAFRFSQDLGRIAETVVHAQLRHDEDARLFYFAGKHECDFVLWKGDRARASIQVCYDPEDRELDPRELAGLVEAMEVFDLREGEIVTHGLTADRRLGGRKIRIRPLWQWLLSASTSSTS